MACPWNSKFLLLLRLLLFFQKLCNTQGRSYGWESAYARTQPVRFEPLEDAEEGASGSRFWANPDHGHHHKYGHPTHFKRTRALPSNTNYISVGKQGNVDFNTVQEAIDAIPENNAVWVEISIRAGVYREKVFIPSNKPFVILQGEGRSTTTIAHRQSASQSGTANSATVTVYSSNFIARGIGFQNDAPLAEPGQVDGQAVAVLLVTDKAAFYSCGFYGGQDTLFDFSGRHYFKECYFEGNIDIISGNGQSVFKNCEIHEIATQAYISGSLTAQKRSSPDENTGFVFINCLITGIGTGQVFLGRAWGPYSRVVYIYTYMDDVILPEGWQDWSNPSRERTVYYGQYQCSGPGSDASQRVKWSHELSDGEAQNFLQLSWIDGQAWLQEV